MKCFYHNDMDGICSGAIVNKFLTEIQGNKTDPCKFIMINYKDEFPFDTIQKDESIVIVDFSLQKPGEFEKLLEITPNVVWIDHHKSAIERFKHLDGILAGIRRNGTA